MKIVFNSKDLFIIGIIIVLMSLLNFTNDFNNANIKINEQQIELNKFIESNNRIVYDYKCEWVSAHYNCELPFENISGKYCNNTIVCQNLYYYKTDIK